MKKLYVGITAIICLLMMSCQAYATWKPEPYDVDLNQQQQQKIEEGAVVVNSSPESTASSDSFSSANAAGTAIVKTGDTYVSPHVTSNIYDTNWQYVQPLETTPNRNGVGNAYTTGTSLSVYGGVQDLESDTPWGQSGRSTVVGVSLNIPLFGGSTVAKRAMAEEELNIRLRNQLVRQEIYYRAENQQAKNLERCIKKFHVWAKSTGDHDDNGVEYLEIGRDAWIQWLMENPDTAIFNACSEFSHPNPEGNEGGLLDTHNQHGDPGQYSGHKH